MGLKDNLQNEPLKNLPLREPILVAPDTPVPVAIERMREKRLGCAIVVDADGRPVGVFTERTIIAFLLKERVDVTALRVADCLDPDCFTLPVTAPIGQLMELVVRRAARFVCVLDEEGRVIALTGQKGLSEYVADHFPQQVMVQRVGGKPGLERREGA